MNISPKQKNGLLIGCFVFIIGLAALVFYSTSAPSLASISDLIERDYDNVKQMDVQRFSELAEKDVIVFDVREQEEFAVSHLSNAIRLSPDTSAEEFEQVFSDRITNKTAIFYCSVGRRSSRLASELQNVLHDNGVVEFYNLRGGIFKWRNEGQPLVTSGQDQTQKVHPYNAFWGRLINDKTAISY